jgi:D-alanyl-D-alanine carboxypeptidase/D-alanyl-D-alanine-endopeptidase (penicillin-binding protein 4)
VSEPDAQSTPKSSFFAKNRLVLTIGGGALAFVLLATGAFFAGTAVGSSRTDASASSGSTDEGDGAVTEPTDDPQRVVPVTIPDANPIRTCTVSALAKDDRLATFSGYVTNLDTGDVLFNRDGEDPARTGSVLKLITASSALQVLGPDYRLTTAVYEGSEPGTVVLVGGGDPTLSRTAEGEESFYVGAPKLADLADQVLAASDPAVPITKIVLDSTYWDSADKWLPSWKRSEQTIGYLSEVTALQVDGDRKNPKKSVSPRSTDPVMAAGGYFAKALGVPDATLEIGARPEGSGQLASVQSQPVSDLVTDMLLASDGTLAEALARVTSKAAGLDGSAASLEEVMVEQMASLGLDTGDLTIIDGSGLSDKNAVSPRFFTQLIALLKKGNDGLSVVYDGLSIAGETGSLASRFTGANAIARGHVYAKTGWIDTEYALAGVVVAEDGSNLAFSFDAIGDGITESAKEALDTLTTGIYSCGDNLSNR